MAGAPAVCAHAAIVVAVGLAPRGQARKGHSSRALEDCNGRPLARVLAERVLETAPQHTLVCVPADDHTAVEVVLRGLRLRCLPIPGGGLGPALAAALKALPRGSDGALVLLCDPALAQARTHLARLLDTWRADPHDPVATAESDGPGLPAVLPREHWPTLIEQRDVGPRALLRDGAQRVATVAWATPTAADGADAALQSA